MHNKKLTDEEARSLAAALLSSASELVKQGKYPTIEQAIAGIFSDIFTQEQIDERIEQKLNDPSAEGLHELAILQDIKPRVEGE